MSFLAIAAIYICFIRTKPKVSLYILLIFLFLEGSRPLLKSRMHYCYLCVSCFIAHFIYTCVVNNTVSLISPRYV